MFDTEKFISEVRKRPIIYDSNHWQHNDKNAKINAWHEVGRVMVQDWDHMTKEEQIVEEKHLRGKWRNIRDYFIKEYKMQCRVKLGQRGRKGRRYAYYHHLSFLEPTVKTKEKNSAPELYVKTEESDADSGNVDEVSMVAGTSAEVKEYLYVHQQNPINNNKKPRYDPLCEVAITSLDNNTEAVDIQGSQGTGQRQPILDEDDYDKMFLLSLLPSLRQIPEHMKLQARIQMQQVLVSALQSKSSTN